MDINQKTGNIEDRKNSQKTATLSPSEWQFDEDTIIAISDLGDILRRIRTRMHAEGYTLVDGKVTKLPTTTI